MRLTELEAHAHTVVDIARTLTAERGDSADTEVLAWAEAVQAGIASHARDLDMAFPWARLVCGNDALSWRAASGADVGLDGDRALFCLAPDPGRHAGPL